MKKKIINISLALLLVLSVCLSVSFSVAAKSEKKPMAWVNAAVNTKKIDDYLPLVFPNGMELYPPDVAIKATIKLLSDGTTVGNVVTHNFDADVMSFTISIDQNCTYFGEVVEGSIAQFVVLLHQVPTDIDYKARFTFYDYDEPGKNDEFLMELYMADWGGPNIWLPFTGSLFLPNGGLANGNVQIHLTD